MSDNPPIAGPAPAAAALLDSAAHAAATAPPPERFRLVRASLPNLLATLQSYTSPASQHLDAAFHTFAEGHKGASNDVALRTVPHFETLREWCAANPDDAARIVLCAVYLANGRYVAQEELAPPEPAPAPEPAEGEAD